MAKWRKWRNSTNYFDFIFWNGKSQSFLVSEWSIKINWKCSFDGCSIYHLVSVTFTCGRFCCVQRFFCFRFVWTIEFQRKQMMWKSKIIHLVITVWQRVKNCIRLFKFVRAINEWLSSLFLLQQKWVRRPIKIRWIFACLLLSIFFSSIFLGPKWNVNRSKKWNSFTETKKTGKICKNLRTVESVARRKKTNNLF